MAVEHVTALGAMSALRGQIEERLLQNEDFRALRALDRAIAELQAPPRLPTAALLPSAVPQGLSVHHAGIADTQAMLQHKMSAKYHTAVA